MRQRIGRRPRGSVGDEPGPARRRLAHRHVDDLPPTGPEHPRNHLPSQQEVAGDVRGEELPEPFGVHRPERLGVGQEPGVHRLHPDAGVVHQHVDASEHGGRHARRRRPPTAASRTSMARPTARPGPVSGQLGGRGARPGRVPTGQDDLARRPRPARHTWRTRVRSCPRRGALEHPSRRSCCRFLPGSGGGDQPTGAACGRPVGPWKAPSR